MKHFLTLIAAILLSTTVAYSAGVSGSVEFYIEKSSEAPFTVDKKPGVDIEITIPKDCTDKFELNLIADYTKNEIIPLYNANGETQELHYDFDVDKDGYHHLKAEILRNGSVYHSYEFEQYYINSVTNQAYNDRGFCVHYEQGKGSEYDADMLKAGGNPVVRDGISWSSVEKVKGEYDFSRADSYVELLEGYGIEILCIVDSYNKGNVLYPDENGNIMMRSESQIDAFGDFVMAAVKRYPQIRKWEILNEPNFVMTGEEYYNIVYSVAKRIKEYDPTVEVYAGGLAKYDTVNFVNEFYLEKLYPFIDGISYHHYNHWRYADGPEFYESTDEIADIMFKEGGWKNLIITESGYSTGMYTEQVPEIKQASDNVKRAVISDWYGMDFLTFYDFKNDGYDEKEREHNFGSVDIQNNPKPGYYTVKQYQKATNRAQYIGEVYISDEITSHLYAANDEYFIIAWAKNENPEKDIRYENETVAEYIFEENVRIEDMFGNVVGGNKLTANYQPSYVFGLSSEFCLNALKQSEQDIFSNLRNIATEFDISIQGMEYEYANIFENKEFSSVKQYVISCYNLAQNIVNEYFYGSLDMTEAAFSTLLSEIQLAAQKGARIAALVPGNENLLEDVTKKYEALSVTPDMAEEKNVAFINEAYYKGKNLLKSIADFDEGDRVVPVVGNGFKLKSDNTMLVSGNSEGENILFRIEDMNGNAVYVNVLTPDENGNYDFSYSPDMPYGEYNVIINNGEVLRSSLVYEKSDDYVSVEDKMTSIVTLQAEKLLGLYESMLTWADIKYDYLNPEVESLIWNETQWINITGKIERLAWAEYTDIILTVKDKTSGKVVYIDSTYPDETGNYRFSFKYTGDASVLEANINQGGINVENRQINLASEDKLITGTMKISPKTDTADIMIQVENYFKLTDKTVQAAFAFYGSEGQLIKCELSDISTLRRDENNQKYSVTKPENAVLLKVFAWDSIENMKPYIDSSFENLD